MNIYEMPEFPINDEVISVLTQNDRIRIERIISTGQQSDWYDREEGRFVILLEGRAQLVFEGKRMITMEKATPCKSPSPEASGCLYFNGSALYLAVCVLSGLTRRSVTMKKTRLSDNGTGCRRILADRMQLCGQGRDKSERALNCGDGTGLPTI